MIGNTNFKGMREIHVHYDMSTKLETNFEKVIIKIIKGEDLDVQE